MAYKQVLAAVDLTEEAALVLAAAKQVADDHSAKLSVVTVVKPLTQVYGGLDMAAYTQATVNFEREAQMQAQQQLASMPEPLNSSCANYRTNARFKTYFDEIMGKIHCPFHSRSTEYSLKAANYVVRNSNGLAPAGPFASLIRKHL